MTGNKLFPLRFQHPHVDRVSANVAGLSQWSHNGESVYFLGHPAGATRCFASGSAVTRSRKWLDLKNFRQAPTMVGYWIGLAPDDSPLLVRDAGVRDFHALSLQLP